MNTSLRQVKRGDWDFILELRNEFFNYFYRQEKAIEKEDHYAYMTKQSSNPKFHQWIIEYESNTVGYVRILENDVGIMIKKEFQNKGIASDALKLVEQKAQKLGISKLIALVKVENEGSKKIFLNNNYELKMYWLEKNF